MKAENENKKRLPWELIVSVIITLIFCSVMVLICYRTVEKMLWQERGTNLNNTMEKITQCINLILEEQWNNLDAYSCRLENERPKTMERTCTLLERAENERSGEGIYLLLFNEKNRYYGSDGIERQWFLDSVDMVDDRMAYVGSFVQYERSFEQIVFVKRLEKAMNVSGETITHMGLVCNMDMLDEAILASSFGEGSSVYIIESDGTQIYHQSREDSIFNVYNIIRAVENYRYLYGGSWEQFRDGIQNNVADCVHFEKNDKHYIVAYHPIEVGNWYAVMVLPGEMVGVSTAKFAHSMMLYFFSISFIVMLLLVVVLQIFDRRSRKKQQEANEKLQKAVQAEKKANVAKRQFLSHISHDIRTPINGILGMLNIAQKNREDQEVVDDCLKKISETAKHLLSLISDILDVSRIESGKIEIQKEQFMMSQMLEECTSIIVGYLDGRNVTFTQDFSGLVHKKFIGDEIHLRQIILNILGNAVRFTPDGKSIHFMAREVSLGCERSVMIYQIEDTGIGMTKEFQKYIFEPFEQENSGARTEYPGTGLGMAIVKQLVDLMEGNISVESEVGKGTTFIVRLPIKYRDQYSETSDGEYFDPEKELKGVRVLVAEDNELNLEVDRYMLETIGIECTVAKDGAQALDIFSKSEPGYFDAIMMDVMMPVMDGLEATKAIRALDRPDAKDIFIFAMTAMAFTEDIEKSKEAGLNDHLTKPINERILYWKLAEHRRGKL